MTSEKEIVFELVRRLLAGETGDVQSHLARLLERSSPLDGGDDFYRLVLPPELANLRLPQDVRDDILATLCAEIARNPDAALLSAVSFTGLELVTTTVAKVVANPPRQMTITEYSYALALIKEYLPYSLVENPAFLTNEEMERLIDVVKELQDVEAGGSIAESLAVRSIKRLAPQLLTVLQLVDRGEWAAGPGPVDKGAE